MIHVVVADDHGIVREGLRQILSAQPDLAVAGEAANHSELIALLRRSACDALVLDIAMPGKNGIETLKQVKQEWPKLPVLMLSMYSEDQYAVRAFKAGASGYLTKLAAAGQVVEAIRRITQGRRYITPELAEALAASFDRDHESPAHKALSDREFSVLRFIAAGKTLTEIGATLSLSPKTVSVYRARLLTKLHLRTNAELTRYAIENGLLE